MSILHKKMSLNEFESGYFYAKEIRSFAKTLGITTENLKKNEIEIHIKACLFGDATPLPVAIPNRKNKSSRDLLTIDTPVINYVSDKKNKNFLLAETEKQFGKLADKSGQWYWINSWRKERILNGVHLTYHDLVLRLAELKQHQGRLPQIPSARMNNFISDYIADSDNQGKGKDEALKAWYELKASKIPKNYQAYKQQADPG